VRLERILIFERACRLSIDHARLKIAHIDEADRHVALVDIAAVILESPQILLSAATLMALANQDIPVILCDAAHYPVASCLMPSTAHVNTFVRQKKQATLALSLQEKIWSRMVTNKILNQHDCLAAHGQEKVLARLKRLAASVKPGDPSNHEAQAAQVYWPALFGKGFTRARPDAKDDVNTALNYGYAVLRALVARYVSLASLSPLWGVGHDNASNPMCLVDDLMEVFRPTVDTHVKLTINGQLTWGREAKQAMLGVLQRRLIIDEREFTLSTAVWEYVNSYVRALMEDSPTLLKSIQWTHR
jgi:CRISP-associated protein Cas1